ncbi:hypothetical protein RB195_025244 [Necator americanus]|uniref:C2H2-type domain-containing protein n=1 Tax=Necator americanus TaxID=51031 RepID=A0ABR1ERG9_NECAM
MIDLSKVWFLNGNLFYCNNDLQSFEVKLEVKKKASSSKPIPEEPCMYCPICDEGFTDHESMACHCEDNHSEDGANGKPQDYTVLLLTFDTVGEFEEWLHEQCERSGTSFFKRSSYAKGSSYSLRCNRAGTYEKATTSKATSSKKDVISCSCFMNVHIADDGKVNIKGCLGHVGHDIEPALLRLNNTQEQLLRTLLEEHSMDYILRRLKRDYSAKTSRLWFVDRSDLWNLTTRFGLRPGYRHKNDMNSLMHRQAEENADDGIRVLEVTDDPSGRGFRLSELLGIIPRILANKLISLVMITPTRLEWLRKFSPRGIAVDDTHNVTRYNLKLATVSVADNKNRGLPAAFLLSGTMTTLDVQRLFLEIKKLLPDFNPQQIVTDEAPCFYNGFRAVFPEARTKLHYCRWHIDQTFKRSATRLVAARIRGQVKKDLSELLLIADLTSFESRFGQILGFLETEGQTGMVNYLKDNYLGKTASWASFANKGAVMDTTMISERWHLRLKKDFLHRNANSRADFLVELLIRAVEDLADSAEIRDRRRLAASSFRVQQSTKCHRWALKHYENSPEKVKRVAEKKWELQGKDVAEKHQVVYLGGCACSESLSENVHCPLCGVCPYSWRCSCLDNRARISCLHRHAAKLYGGGVVEEHPSTSQVHEIPHTQLSETMYEVDQVLSTQDLVTAAQERKQQRTQIRSNIESKYAVLSANVNILVNTDTEEAAETLKKIYDLVDQASKLKVSQPSTEGVHIAARPELTKPGAKPQLTKAELYTRSQYRSKKKKEKSKEGN